MGSKPNLDICFYKVLLEPRRPIHLCVAYQYFCTTKANWVGVTETKVMQNLKYLLASSLQKKT